MFTESRIVKRKFVGAAWLMRTYTKPNNPAVNRLVYTQRYFAIGRVKSTQVMFKNPV